MDIIHITITKNIRSILKNGLLRSKPILFQYDKVMKKDYGSCYNKEKGIVFGFLESINHRDRIIKDFFYWKTWGENRNKFLCHYNNQEFDELQNIGNRLFLPLKLKPLQFTILLVNIPYEDLYDLYKHKQSIDMGVFWQDMDVRYEHDDKPLCLINYDIKPEKIKIIGTGESIIKRNNRIDVRLSI